MIEHDPIGNDSRRRRQAARFGRNPACLLCDERDPDWLRLVNKTLLEEHHLAGQANDAKATVILCRNCHAKLTAGMLRAGMQLSHEIHSTPEKVAQLLRGLAMFFDMLANTCEVNATRLTGHVASLDAKLPEWRQLPNTGP